MSTAPWKTASETRIPCLSLRSHNHSREVGIQAHVERQRYRHFHAHALTQAMQETWPTMTVTQALLRHEVQRIGKALTVPEPR